MDESNPSDDEADDDDCAVMETIMARKSRGRDRRAARNRHKQGLKMACEERKHIEDVAGSAVEMQMRPITPMPATSAGASDRQNLETRRPLISARPVTDKVQPPQVQSGRPAIQSRQEASTPSKGLSTLASSKTWSKPSSWAEAVARPADTSVELPIHPSVHAVLVELQRSSIDQILEWFWANSTAEWRSKHIPEHSQNLPHPKAFLIKLASDMLQDMLAPSASGLSSPPDECTGTSEEHDDTVVLSAQEGMAAGALILEALGHRPVQKGNTVDGEDECEDEDEGFVTDDDFEDKQRYLRADAPEFVPGGVAAEVAPVAAILPLQVIAVGGSAQPMMWPMMPDGMFLTASADGTVQLPDGTQAHLQLVPVAVPQAEETNMQMLDLEGHQIQVNQAMFMASDPSCSVGQTCVAVES
mmetsp:Transcript_8230/g.18406  ORF Transcript_8230/g.18406 Transcript_8230/m.18406 type:complete len:415 (-) Transcript_8230:200-1444(-)